MAGNSERLVELLGMWEMLIFINPIRYGTGSEIIKMCKGNFILPITLARRGGGGGPLPNLWFSPREGDLLIGCSQ